MIDRLYWRWWVWSVDCHYRLKTKLQSALRQQIRQETGLDDMLLTGQQALKLVLNLQAPLPSPQRQDLLNEIIAQQPVHTVRFNTQDAVLDEQEANYS
jgi:hypothetical protein